ncbi:hypothetical protein [Polymorphum gilvum]|uniref:Uncharacterized protein n=1 Tax=Polymorphum gilvum (strain LMG 25793 / CGMCC 1.9160 / SL003B-26A1) TaxID=991905 RepID=F2IYR8_POLGS|nr:hypothetical protein [Polymorphum gilvum]ADZ69515.1 hypothetical protein SL003B_1086 [Polymorphum gilvum SL003B-26A1]
MSTTYSECMVLARVELEVAKRLVNEEISAYPAPIAGCDQQFNQLLSERHRITRALQELTAEVHIPTPRAP